MLYITNPLLLNIYFQHYFNENSAYLSNYMLISSFWLSIQLIFNILKLNNKNKISVINSHVYDKKFVTR